MKFHNFTCSYLGVEKNEFVDKSKNALIEIIADTQWLQGKLLYSSQVLKEEGQEIQITS